MEVIAQETKRETVSMRVITLVTLFFLPGTFISVGTILSRFVMPLIQQTLMSTPIVTFEAGSPSISHGTISAGALGFFVAVSIPLMVVTVLAWWASYWWEDRRERKEQRRLSNAYPMV